MRLDVSAAGAVAYGLLVAGAAARIPPATMLEARGDRKIIFTEFSQYLYRYNSTMMIQWTLGSDYGINITNVSLHRIDENGQLIGVVGEGVKVPAVDTPSTSPVVRVKPGNRFFEATDEQGLGHMSVGTRDQNSEPLTFPYATEEAGGSATLPRSDEYFARYFKDDLINTALCLSVSWYEGRPMRSYSHAFALTEETNLSAPSLKALDETFRKTSYIAVYEGPDMPLSSPAAPSSSSEADPNSAGGNPALSVAAQAGIGVGVGIAGLLLIGGLVFFFCRRRRRGPKPYGRGAGAAFASDSGVMVRGDKEMAGVSQSGPHSLYAPDPSRPHEHEHDDAPAVGGRDPRHSGYGDGGDPRHSGYGGGGGDDDVESYRAEPPAPGAPPHGNDGGVGRATPTTTTPSRPTSEVRSPSRYAHLIEEGMTQDEIQRLEEEERQLDAAIENAGRGSRAARGEVNRDG